MLYKRHICRFEPIIAVYSAVCGALNSWLWRPPSSQRAIIGSRRLIKFFILTARWGYQQPARLNPPAATNAG